MSSSPTSVNLDLFSDPDHPEDKNFSSDMRQFETGVNGRNGISTTVSSLTARQALALECLVTMPNNTLTEVANAAGISRPTLWRYLQDSRFQEEYKRTIAGVLKSARAKVAAALVRGASESGSGQSGMQKLYWQLIGDLKDSLELSGEVGVNVKTLKPEDLSPEVREALFKDIKRIGSGSTDSANSEKETE